MEINRHFYKAHLFYPLLVFILLTTFLEVSQIDLILGDWLFNFEGGEWSLRRTFLFSDVMHTGGANFFKLFISILVLFWVASYFIEKIKAYRKPLLYIAIIVPISVALVTNFGKYLTHVDCPWDLIRYGGQKPYLGIFESHPGTYAFGKCFPAGHSSIGFSLLSLYFFFLEVVPKLRFYGLAAGLVMGSLFGLAQQFRGAHFISHDLWTAAICWFISLTWYLLLFRNGKGQGIRNC